MKRWIQTAAVVAVIAIAFVIFIEVRRSSEAAAWSRLGEARASADPVTALESAREATAGSPAEPWVGFDLTMALYEEGSAEDLKRAAQVAQATIDQDPDHPASKLLESILPALASYDGLAGG